MNDHSRKAHLEGILVTFTSCNSYNILGYAKHQEPDVYILIMLDGPSSTCLQGLEFCASTKVFEEARIKLEIF